MSIDLDGKDPRTHLRSDNATEFRVSPDGRWVAWTERFNAYVTPFAATGKPIEIGPKSTALPVRRVTRDAGEFLHWSGDSKRLHWSLGPELYTRDAQGRLRLRRGRAGEAAGARRRTGLNLGFTAKSDVPTGTRRPGRRAASSPCTATR